MKVALDKPKNLTKMRNYAGTIVPWIACKPFVENSLAVLIHRPRSVATHKIGERWPAHISVSCWCGNTMSGTKKFTFLDAPSDEMIVCARCEDNAMQVGLPSSSDLAGKHVHTGGVVAEMRCCASAIRKGEAP